jgi:hypothetical protein
MRKVEVLLTIVLLNFIARMAEGPPYSAAADKVGISSASSVPATSTPLASNVTITPMVEVSPGFVMITSLEFGVETSKSVLTMPV